MGSRWPNKIVVKIDYIFLMGKPINYTLLVYANYYI